MMGGVPVEVEDMRNVLQYIQNFSYPSNTIDEIQASVKKQLREAAFLVEDVIDEYMIFEERKPPDPGCAALSCEIVDFIKTMILRHQIKRRFNDLNSQLGVINEIHSSSEQETHSRRNFQEAALYMDEADIVGFEAPTAKLVDWLLKEKEDRTVVGVVGMAGLGKTTLARKVFFSKKVISHFGCCLWINVSQSYTVQELLRQLLYSIYRHKLENDSELWTTQHDISQMGRELLTDKVSNYLYQNKYVVFFDDVWDIKFSSEIQFALPDNKNGSRILITTRNMDVAQCFRGYSFVKIHEMQPLNLVKSLELFTKKAFSDLCGTCPQDLKDVCLEIVKKCKGLPLAIVAFAGFLSVKGRNVIEWHKFSENLHSAMINSPHLSAVIQTFCSDYDHLPSILKSCLLYFAIYPEDYEIKSKRLIRHWIAEGFVKEEEGITLEEVAESNLIDLIRRCLVQYSSVSIDGGVKGVHIHDLFLVLLREKARDYSFCKFVIGHDRSLRGIIRRLSITNTSDDFLELIESSHVRSLFFFAEDELPESFVKGIPTKYKLLKVLDFENARLLDVPENVGDLIHLKYLSFRNTNISSIPKSIGKLQNMETLDLRQTNVTELPKEISKLIKLQHLLGNKMSLIHLKGDIGGMESLQTLSEVRIDEDGIELITELGKLTQLKKLSLFNVREGQGIALCSSINKMQHLEKLYIEAKSEDAAIDLSFISCPTMLKKLCIKAKLNKLPEWIPKLTNLVKLSMSYSQLTEDPLESLRNLPCLLVLNLLVRSYEGESLHFQGGFRYLKELGLRYLSNLESIIVEEGALESLKELTIMNIPNLKTAPYGINYLEKLDVLNTHFMPAEFEKCIAPLAKHIKEKNLDNEKRRY